MINTTENVIKFVEKRLESILRCPDMWGSPLAVETQILQLLDVYFVANDKSDLTCDLMSRLGKFIHSHIRETNLPLCSTLGLENKSSDEFVKLLREFIEAEKELVKAA